MADELTAVTPGPRSRPAPQQSGPAEGAVAEFEALYRANVAAVTAYFARRSAEPPVVADLTADTFVAAITSFATFDPRKGTARAWVFGIARRVDNSAGVAGANTALHRLKAGVVVVPVGAGCPSIDSLPRPQPDPHLAVLVSARVNSSGHRSVSVRITGSIPAGDTMILAFSGNQSTGSVGVGGMITGPVPACVSLPSGSFPPASPGSGSSQAG